ncbi:hypothetical protein [Paenibacillus popilliae]|uniref:Seryl-tRNA synthetase n=1 Tax=Paenibacillus popilliae ATCC 14706 TaxID=1212764 RepID=M9M814_PAEPP|nr:hypothetical protein [Paenibacillus popilliae]GAC44003.1 seryl-tRNA synthetase [Paenibacillus popilliae ATCC 14706]
MTEKEAGQLLVIITEFVPSYVPTESRVKQWQKGLGTKLTFTEAKRYMNEHFKESRFIPVPADLLKRRPRKTNVITLDQKERDYLEELHRRQRERNAAARGTSWRVSE